MIRAADLNKLWRRRRTSKHPIKLTALAYLREAILNEVYEDCALAIDIAKEFGAEEFEIQNLLEDPRRKPE
ncbi:MAG: hypothetical protein HY583_02355 [Candidatus Omnitrophica bacterium]|nr:hypothetical protein [Candidatus Omnitrophota bacterium]